MRIEELLIQARHRPLLLKDVLWPHVTFWDKQVEIIESVRTNVETWVPSANEMGKDFVSGFIALWKVLCFHPVKGVTSSATAEQLVVLWGEIDKFIRTARAPLTMDRGGPLAYNHMNIRKVVNGKILEDCYLRGIVATSEKKGEGLSGHHQTFNFCIFDETSGIPDIAYHHVQGWCKCLLGILNPNKAAGFAYEAIKGGDVKKPLGQEGYYRKIIQLKASESVNVKAGRKIIPGVLTIEEYNHRRATWHPIRQKIGLDAEFDETAAFLLFPYEWLEAAAERARISEPGKVIALGIDPAEGGDSTSWCAIDARPGLVELLSIPTPDTSKIPLLTIELMKRFDITPEQVVFDRGGGGYEHACTLRSMGYNVRAVGFGEAMTADPKKVKTAYESYEKRLTKFEDRLAYTNRRAQMYWEASAMFDPLANPGTVFALLNITAGHRELRRQLAAMPKAFDPNGRGRAWMPPKPELVARLGHSPDEADALVLAIHAMLHPAKVVTAGAAW